MAIDILVVEDEYTERQELTQLLETVTPPEHIRSAATCSAAIAAISQLCPDLILLDIMLRGSSGFEVAEFVRSNRLDCKIIILTAYHEFDFASKALSMDLQDYLLKPVRPSVLLQRVRDVLHLSSPASAATGLAVWPYLACGISSPLPPIPNLLPNMTVVGILRDGTDREVISQINLALHGTGWTEQDRRRRRRSRWWRHGGSDWRVSPPWGSAVRRSRDWRRVTARPAGQRTAAFSIRRERWCAGIRPLMCRSLTP